MEATDLGLACQAQGWPLTMTGVLEQASRKAGQEHQVFQRQLKADTAQLQDDITSASRQVSAFATLSDINEQTEYAQRGQTLMAFLAEGDERIARINSEESLLELPRSEYPRVAQLQKELQPYLDLWVRAWSCAVWIHSVGRVYLAAS